MFKRSHQLHETPGQGAPGRLLLMELYQLIFKEKYLTRRRSQRIKLEIQTKIPKEMRQAEKVYKNKIEHRNGKLVRTILVETRSRRRHPDHGGGDDGGDMAAAAAAAGGAHR